MIRNILYSLFIHSILILLIYFSFNPTPPIEIDKTVKVAVSFVVKPGNAVESNVKVPPAPMPPVPTEIPPTLQPKTKPEKTPPVVKKAQPKPKKSKPKSEPKKLDSDKKTQPKQEAAKAKPKAPDAKTDSSKVKEPNKKDDAKQEPEKPKFSEKKPEVKEEIKKPKVEEKPVPEPEIDDDSADENEEKAADEQQYSFTENSVESLDLLGREKFNIQTQIKRCYRKAMTEDGDNKMVINAHIFVAKDGFIDLDVVVFKNIPEQMQNGVESEEFRKAKETVKKALKFCSPIRNLPPDKYDIWKEIDLQFD